MGVVFNSRNTTQIIIWNKSSSTL